MFSLSIVIRPFHVSSSLYTIVEECRVGLKEAHVDIVCFVRRCPNHKIVTFGTELVSPSCTDPPRPGLWRGAFCGFSAIEGLWWSATSGHRRAMYVRSNQDNRGRMEVGLAADRALVHG